MLSFCVPCRPPSSRILVPQTRRSSSLQHSGHNSDRTSWKGLFMIPLTRAGLEMFLSVLSVDLLFICPQPWRMSCIGAQAWSSLFTQCLHRGLEHTKTFQQTFVEWMTRLWEWGVVVRVQKHEMSSWRRGSPEHSGDTWLGAGRIGVEEHRLLDHH